MTQSSTLKLVSDHPVTVDPGHAGKVRAGLILEHLQEEYSRFTKDMQRLERARRRNAAAQMAAQQMLDMPARPFVMLARGSGSGADTARTLRPERVAAALEAARSIPVGEHDEDTARAIDVIIRALRTS